MGNKSSSLLQDEEINIIGEETGFTPFEIERLYSRFTALDRKGNGSLSRQDCLAIPELAINPLCDRIVQLFFSDCDDDHDRINFRQFMKVLASFRSTHRSLSRNSTRQDSLSGRDQQALLKQQAPLLFDTIDPSPFSPALARHPRHSSYHDGFHHHHHHHLESQHHNHTTTNQHSFHYAASTNHLPAQANGLHHHANHHHHHHNHHHHHHHHHHQHNGPAAANGQASPAAQVPIVDPDEPLNSKSNKLYFMFKIYDVNDDNLVDFQDLLAILKMMVGTYVDEARVQKIAQRSLREADTNNDGYIDFQEFCAAFAGKDIDELLKVKFPHS